LYGELQPIDFHLFLIFCKTFDLMNYKLLIRICFLVFLFAIGYLVGGGIGKTVRQFSQIKQEVPVILPIVKNKASS